MGVIFFFYRVKTKRQMSRFLHDHGGNDNDLTCDCCTRVDSVTVCATPNCSTDRHKTQLCEQCCIVVHSQDAATFSSPICRHCFEKIPRQKTHDMSVSFASLQHNYKTHVPHDPTDSLVLVKTLRQRISDLEMQLFILRQAQAEKYRKEYGWNVVVHEDYE